MESVGSKVQVGILTLSHLEHLNVLDWLRVHLRKR